MTPKNRERILGKVDILREKGHRIKAWENEHAKMLAEYWQYHSEYGALAEDIRADVKTATQSDPKSQKQVFGPFELRPKRFTVVNVPLLIKRAPEVLAKPDVVKGVDHEILHHLVLAHQLDVDIYNEVVEQDYGTPSLYGPKAAQRPEVE